MIWNINLINRAKIHLSFLSVQKIINDRIWSEREREVFSLLLSFSVSLFRFEIVYVCPTVRSSSAVSLSHISSQSLETKASPSTRRPLLFSFSPSLHFLFGSFHIARHTHIYTLSIRKAAKHKFSQFISLLFELYTSSFYISKDNQR